MPENELLELVRFLIYVNDEQPSFQIRPPWIVYPSSDPVWGGWRQGESEQWLLDIWLPFWQGLGPDEQNLYLERFPPPDKEWNLYLTQYWK
ncbi:hypothetical protein [Leptospira santarosai]|uniref:hypothetical protein n=1 Tax=Leptospira santarosai TaxID=28183 RepID=UPI0009D744DB|nr:hypothetical protein [Leptospira santarosai]MDI7174909.1 hypothetical protein [Leptospira santarosai]MDI7193976.1 hypothetical protein [Leptospira santarosai]MDO6398961.1 hypothetical protein [Leptospira santarosai]